MQTKIRAIERLLILIVILFVALITAVGIVFWSPAILGGVVTFIVYFVHLYRKIQKSQTLRKNNDNLESNFQVFYFVV